MAQIINAPGAPAAAGSSGITVKTASGAPFVLVTNTKVAHDHDNPYLYAGETGGSNAATVNIIRSGGATSLDLFHAIATDDGSAITVTTSLKVKLYGYFRYQKAADSLTAEDHPAAADTTNWDLPNTTGLDVVLGDSGKPGWWFPLLRESDSTHEFDFSTALDIVTAGTQTKEMGIQYARENVALFGADLVMALVSQAAAGTNADAAVLMGLLRY